MPICVATSPCAIIRRWWASAGPGAQVLIRCLKSLPQRTAIHATPRRSLQCLWLRLGPSLKRLLSKITGMTKLSRKCVSLFICLLVCKCILSTTLCILVNIFANLPKKLFSNYSIKICKIRIKSIRNIGTSTPQSEDGIWAITACMWTLLVNVALSGQRQEI